MKLAGRPFRARHDSGRCSICKKPISKGQMIRRLETTATWSKEKITYRGRAYGVRCFADYVHDECLEDKDGTE